MVRRRWTLKVAIKVSDKESGEAWSLTREVSNHTLSFDDFRERCEAFVMELEAQRTLQEA